MKKKKPLEILFIGNSHTYKNDMPLMVRRRAIECGYECRVTMIAHGGWFLAQHAEEPDVRFNILFGGYDYVVLQEHAHPFGPVEKFRDAAVRLNSWIREAGSTPVIFDTWAKKSEPDMQEKMKEYQNALDTMSSEATEYVRGIPVVKTFGQTVHSFKRFKDSIDGYGKWTTAYTLQLRLPMIGLPAAASLRIISRALTGLGTLTQSLCCGCGASVTLCISSVYISPISNLPP